MEKKTDKPELKSLLEDTKTGKEHISGKLGDFRLDFANNGVIRASREYLDVGATAERMDGGLFEKKLTIPKVEISVTYDMWALFPDTLVEMRKIQAQFSLAGERHKMEGEMNAQGGIMWYESDKEGQIHFTDSFHRKISKDILPMREQLELVVKTDKDVGAAFRADMARREHLESTVINLADRAEQIPPGDLSNPLSLQPIFNEAKKSGMVTELLLELVARAADNRLQMAHLDYNSPQKEDMRRRTERLSNVVTILEGFIKEDKKTKSAQSQ